MQMQKLKMVELYHQTFHCTSLSLICKKFLKSLILAIIQIILLSCAVLSYESRKIIGDGARNVNFSSIFAFRSSYGIRIESNLPKADIL